jgi:hypothetical protein
VGVLERFFRRGYPGKALFCFGLGIIIVLLACFIGRYYNTIITGIIIGLLGLVIVIIPSLYTYGLEDDKL